MEDSVNSIKRHLFTFIQVCLWLTFFLAIFDTGILGQRAADSAFAPVAIVIDPLYRLANLFLWPITTLATLLGFYSPGQTTGGFPLATAADWANIMAPLGWSSIFTPTTFPGVIIWWVPIASFFYSGLSYVLDPVLDRVRNTAWNLIVEYGFQQRRAKQYAEALDKKKSDLDKLDNQYRALVQEAHTLKDSVITDELTMVYNKRFFLSQLQQEFEMARRNMDAISLIMIDIDYFKKLNDTYGHLAGDKVLKAVAEVIKQFTPGRCYPCRYGGEEFSVIMPQVHTQEAWEAARKIQEHVQLLRFNDLDRKLRVSVSQGICTLDFSIAENRNITHFDGLLERADQELYRSKMEGRNRISIHRQSQG